MPSRLKETEPMSLLQQTMLQHWNCRLQKGNFLNDALSEMFCIGIADVETQKKWRAGKTLSFAEAH